MPFYLCLYQHVGIKWNQGSLIHFEANGATKVLEHICNQGASQAVAQNNVVEPDTRVCNSNHSFTFNLSAIRNPQTPQHLTLAQVLQANVRDICEGKAEVRQANAVLGKVIKPLISEKWALIEYKRFQTRKPSQDSHVGDFLTLY
jgi:hypothetical protein